MGLQLFLFKDGPLTRDTDLLPQVLRERKKKKKGKCFSLKWRYLFKLERLYWQKLLIIPLAPLKTFCSLLPAAVWACEVSPSFELHAHAFKLDCYLCAHQQELHLGHMSSWLAIERRSTNQWCNGGNAVTHAGSTFIRSIIYSLKWNLCLIKVWVNN